MGRSAESFTWPPEEAVALDGMGFAVALAVVVALAFLLPEERKKKIKAPIVSLVLFVLTEVATLALPADWDLVDPLRVVAVFFLLLCIGRGGFLLVIESRLGGSWAAGLPKIFQDVLQVFVYAAVVLTSLRVAGVEPSSLLTTSALITAVIGLSLQDTLGNIFSGLALEAQRPFEVGDWVKFEGDASMVGQVIEINWRATRVLTLNRVEVILPNATIAKSAIINYTKPSKVSRRQVTVAAAYGAPPERVKAALIKAVDGVPKALKVPAPSVVLSSYGDSGINYVLRYFTDDFKSAELTDAEVRDRMWYALRRADITIPFPQRDVHFHQVSEEDRERARKEEVQRMEEAMRKVSVLEPVGPPMLHKLAERSMTRLYAKGETIILQGDRGHAMFIVLDGEVVVQRDREGKPPADLAKLGPGQFFGEMSLMTGEARSASVRARTECELVVVDSEGFRSLLESRPQLAERISEVLAERKLALELSADASTMVEQERKDQTSREILVRIRRFFSL